ncbi:MAG: hypothetical protein HWQ38_17245 [Nostoc sp. NMS7]|nr:hypothetical protein [Nostoc sp. NMS7]MBN3948103.1 hypothetical protein [Nostoc sp. NMS7]
MHVARVYTNYLRSPDKFPIGNYQDIQQCLYKISLEVVDAVNFMKYG